MRHLLPIIALVPTLVASITIVMEAHIIDGQARTIAQLEAALDNLGVANIQLQAADGQLKVAARQLELGQCPTPGQTLVPQ